MRSLWPRCRTIATAWDVRRACSPNVSGPPCAGRGLGWATTSATHVWRQTNVSCMARGIETSTGPAEDFLSLDDDKLWQQCKLERFRASGPGGQHRNKVESGVRLIHEPTGVVATATERRSQHENRKVAMTRLRQKIALTVRRTVDSLDSDNYDVPEALASILTRPKKARLGPNHRDYQNGVQDLLDLLVVNELSVALTAGCLGVSTGALVRFLGKDPVLLAEVNRLRTSSGMSTLRK